MTGKRDIFVKNVNETLQRWALQNGRYRMGAIEMGATEWALKK